MQLRYLGDSHDYIKFAPPRHLHTVLNLTIGVNWYLTSPEINGDGEQRGYLRNPEWPCLDPPLVEKMKPFLKPNYRNLNNFKRDKVLPAGTLYYDIPVSAANARSNWHKGAIACLGEAGLVFLDQDNGFEVKSMTSRTQAKYLLYQEAFDYYNDGKVVVAIQFAAKVDPKNRAQSVRSKLINSEKCTMNLPVMRGRVTPNILFLIIAPREKAKPIQKALEAFEKKSPTVQGISRIELIR